MKFCRGMRRGAEFMSELRLAQGAAPLLVLGVLDRNDVNFAHEHGDSILRMGLAACWG